VSASDDRRKLDRGDLLSAWQHFETQATDDKNKMIATASWLISLSVTLLTMSFTEYCGENALGCRSLLIGAVILSLFSTLMVITFAGHANRRYNLSNRVRRTYICRDFADVDIAFGPEYVERKYYILGSHIGRIFDGFFIFSMIVAVVSIFALATVLRSAGETGQ
jgi:hypothetical protein